MTWTITPKEAKTKDRLSPQLNGQPDGPTSTRFYLFDWADIKNQKAEYETLGYPTRSAPGTLSRNLPERDPQRNNVWASAFQFYENIGSLGYEPVSVEGFPRKIQKWTESVYRVDYSWRPYPVYEDSEVEADGEYGRFVEIKEDGQTDYITPASLESMFKWAAPGTIPPETCGNITNGKLIPYANVSMTWHQVPYRYYPRDAIMNAYGKVSKEDLGTAGEKNFYAAGTLLFLGARRRHYLMAHPETNWDDQAVVDLEYFFRHDPGSNTDDDPDTIGPNTFPCFIQGSPGFGKRFLISKNGAYFAIGSRDDVCIFDEFIPMDLFTVT